MTAPKWTTQLHQTYTAGIAHSFILHFNVHDTQAGTTLEKYLSRLLIGDPADPLMKIVAFYDRAHGFSFASESMRREMIEVLNLGQDQDPMIAALSGNEGGEPELPSDPAEALPLLDALLHTPDVAVIIRNAETLVPESDIGTMAPADRDALVMMQSWGRDSQIASYGNMVVLLTENQASIHSQIRAASTKYESILIDIPSEEERKEYIDQIQPQTEFAWDMDSAALARSTAGLSLIHIKDIVLRAAQTGTLSPDLVRERKESIIRSEYEVIEIMEPTAGWESIGGLQRIKDFFDRSVIRPIQQGNRKRVPMGILMTGPAGTGKSIVAQAVAKESGINAVNLNLARILGQYVGNSERNLEKALRAIKSLAPTIVFIDEIDQSVSRGESGDSGVSSRIFKRLLEFMSDTDNRGKVVFLAATNRPDLMDAALRRPGRFDKKIPFLIPDESERREIFKVMCRKYISPDQYPTEIPPEAIANAEGWTGAEIEATTVKASEIMEDENLPAHAALIDATRRLSPSTADIEFMTMLAIKECNDLDLLPAQYRDRLKDRAALDEQISQTKKDRKLNI
jgi:transitional endoplasmic reticulum ATPase